MAGFQRIVDTAVCTSNRLNTQDGEICNILLILTNVSVLKMLDFSNY